MKNPNTKSLVLFFSFLVLLFNQCTLDKNDVLPDYDIEVGQSEEHAISGVVIDDLNQPVTNARVDIMGTITQTDENGFFYVEDAKVFSKHAYVKVIKQGYFLGSRSFYPTEGTNIVDIKLLKKKLAGSFVASNGGSVSFESVNIDMGAGFVTELGNAYTGNVNVSGAYIDPTASDINEIMPGSFRGVNLEGEALLASFGMMAVELTDDNGNPLQLADGNTAEISSPIPTDLQSSAPATLPLWYFNEEKGYWVEEGEATKVGDKYVGTVKHFSFWNCDIKIDAREANSIIKHESGLPVQNVRIQINTNTIAGNREGRSSSSGKFRGLMPINVDIEFVLSGGPEGLEPYSFTTVIGEDGQLDDIVIPDSYFPRPVPVSGKIVDCNSEATDEVRLILGGRYVVPTTNGSFQLNLVSNTTRKMELRHKTNYKRQILNDLVVGDLGKDIGVLQFCPDGTLNGLEVDYTESIKSFVVSYDIEGSRYSRNGQIKVGENKDKGQMSIILGNGSKGEVITDKFLEITMLSDFKMDGQPHYYTFNEDRTDRWIIDLTTGLSANEPIIPAGISVDFFKWDLSPGGYSKVVFYGDFEDFDPAQQQYVQRTVTNGVIEFTMED